MYQAFMEAELPPPTDCLAPMGVRRLLKGMLEGVRAELSRRARARPEGCYRDARS